MFDYCHVHNRLNSGQGRFVYCGRGVRPSSYDPTYAYDPSPLRNTNYRKTSDPAGSTLPKFKKDLWAKIKDGDREVMELMDLMVKWHLAGERVVLMCHCHDHSTCHTSVIKAALEWYAREYYPQPVES